MADRKSSTSVQFSDTQFKQLEEIVLREKVKSNAEIIRRSFDFYVSEKYPELKKIGESIKCKRDI